MKKTLLLIIFSAFIAFNCQLSAQTTDSTLKWKVLYDSTLFYMEKSDFETALKWSEIALPQAEKEFGKMDTNYIMSLNSIIDNYYNLSNFDSAIFYCEIRLSICRKLFKSDNIDLANSINDLGFFYDKIADYKKAESLFTEVLEMKRRIYHGDDPELAKTIGNLGHTFNEKGDYLLAEPLYIESLEMYRRIYHEDNSDLANSINNMAEFYLLKGEYTKAENLYIEALEMRKHLFKSDNSDLALSINNLARFYLEIGLYNKAEPLFIESYEMFKRIYTSDNPKLAFSISNLGYFYQKMGEYSKAEPLFIESIEMSRHLYKTDHPDLAMRIGNLANFYLEISDLKKAELLFEEALKINRNFFKKDHVDLARCINNMAQFYQNVNEYKKAEPLNIEAIDMIRKIFNTNNQDLALYINNLAVLYYKIKDYKKADSLLNEALEMYRSIFKIPNQELARCINNIALVYDKLDNIKKEEELLLESLDIYRNVFKNDNPETANCLNNLGLLYEYNGNEQKAESYYLESYNMRKRLLNTDNPDLAKSMRDLAAFYENKKKLKADTLYKESIKMISNYLINTFPIFSEKGKELFWDNFEIDYIWFNSVVVNRWKENPSMINYAYNNCLLTKGLLLNSVQKVKNVILNSNNKDLLSKYDEWLVQKSIISKYYTTSEQQLKDLKINLDSIIDNANSKEKELSKLSYNFAKEYTEKKIVWQDVHNSLGKDEAAIELVRYPYYIKNCDSFPMYYSALILRKDSSSPQLVVLDNGTDLEKKHILKYNKMVRDLSDEYKNGNKIWTDSYINNSLKDMYINFWQKIQEKLVGVKTVYLCVDGVYNKINLNTLINPETGKYLAEELDLRIVTSTRDLVNRFLIVENNKSGNNTAELFGSPKFNLDSNEINDISRKYAVNKQSFDYNSSNNKLSRGSSDTLLRGLGYDELPGTKTEIEKIAEILKSKGWTTNTHTGIDATEESVKSVRSPKILHIATHGEFDRNNETSEEQKKIYENPLLKSKLILAGGENTRLKLGNNESIDSGTEDGYLTAYEVMNMNLDNTELVVLSACETGLGEIKNGEGVYGLQRAFQVAGAKSLIMSLWKVPDAPTQELMLSFYSKWLGGMDKREAFRQSQMELAKNYPNFYYWGAFEIITNY
jgi:CHAT domain-containing protein/Flp pilus assembly protein TadD